MLAIYGFWCVYFVSVSLLRTCNKCRSCALKIYDGIVYSILSRLCKIYVWHFIGKRQFFFSSIVCIHILSCKLCWTLYNNKQQYLYYNELLHFTPFSTTCLFAEPYFSTWEKVERIFFCIKLCKSDICYILFESITRFGGSFFTPVT